MSSILEQFRFYGRLAANLLQSKHDLYALPGPPSYPGVGHIPHMLRPDYHVQILEWANQYGGMFRFCLGQQWIVVVTDPQLAIQVLARGAGGVPRKSVGYQFFDLATNHLGAHSFFTTSDEAQWSAIRKAASPAFSVANVRRSFPCMLRHAGRMADSLLASAGSLVDVQEDLELMLLDVFVEALFEVPPEQFPGAEVSHAMSSTLEEANQRLMLPLRELWQSIVHPAEHRSIAKAQQTLGEVYGFMADLLRERDNVQEGGGGGGGGNSSSSSSTNLWAGLARARDPATGNLLTRDQLIPEIGALMMAGFDTSSHTIVWCLYTIASHPEVQRRLQHELEEAQLLQGAGRSPRGFTFDDLSRLCYLNCVVDETMRMYPVAATASVRELERPTRVGKYILPTGVIVWPMMYGLHNSEHNWHAPSQFMPERWSARHGLSRTRARPGKGRQPAGGAGAWRAPVQVAAETSTRPEQDTQSGIAAGSQHAPSQLAGRPADQLRGSSMGAAADAAACIPALQLTATAMGLSGTEGGQLHEGAGAGGSTQQVGTLPILAATSNAALPHTKQGRTPAVLGTAPSGAGACSSSEQDVPLLPCAEAVLPPPTAQPQQWQDVGALASCTTAGGRTWWKPDCVGGSKDGADCGAGQAPFQAHDIPPSNKAFLPFSDGIKSCLGQNLGLMEVRAVLAVLLSRMHISLDPCMELAGGVKDNMIMSLTLKIRGGMRIICSPLP